MSGVLCTWRPRQDPLPPCAALGCDHVAQGLVQRLLTYDEARLARLQGLGSARMVVILGPGEDLPWVPGTQYLGSDSRAPQLLLPTTLLPDIPLPLLAQALRQQEPRTPLALIPAPALLLPLDGARPLERAYLTQWLLQYQAQEAPV